MATANPNPGGPIYPGKEHQTSRPLTWCLNVSGKKKNVLMDFLIPAVKVPQGEHHTMGVGKVLPLESD
jgi:hypothetical protein